MAEQQSSMTYIVDQILTATNCLVQTGSVWRFQNLNISDLDVSRNFNDRQQAVTYLVDRLTRQHGSVRAAS